MQTNSIKILVVDDEPDILEIIDYNLKKEGFEVMLASNGEECLSFVKKFNPKLILLDIMMPRLDGIETCKRLRKIPELDEAFILFLTAKADEITEITCFNVGADDYITKPIKPIALVSRLKAILKRMPDHGKSNPAKITFKNLVIDKESYTVFCNELPIIFTKKEFELLYTLASKPGKVFTREEIFNRVWGNDTVVADRTIDVHIRRIREKIGEEIISTIKGVGYKVDI